jgi:hypothetical protein
MALSDSAHDPWSGGRLPEREVELLERQLERMRGMLFEYSRLFFVHMRTWTIVVLGVLAASLIEPLGGLVLVVPYLVPFVFLEASYLFWYTVFARRHAEWLERAIAARLTSTLPVAHRLEAAYFYPPDAPKIAALSLARPSSHMSVMTLAYSAGAGLLWLAGLVLSLEWVSGQGGGSPLPDLLLGLTMPAALAWTMAITGYLVWTWLRSADEARLLAALDAAYPEGARPDSASGSPVSPNRT